MNKNAISVSLLLAAAAFAPVAQAREGLTDGPGATPVEPDTVSDIIVTARKKKERLSDVPIAISAFTGQQLQDRGVASLLDLSALSAGVVLREDVAGRASPSIVIRGVGYDDFRSNGNPAVAVTVDQVYYGSNALIGGALFDIDRVEILKGPQGTLYGRNTTAGAVNVITRGPSDQLAADVRGEYGSYRHFKGEAGIGGPITDQLGFRLAATYESGGGFLTNKGTQAYAGTSPSPKVPALPLVPESDHVGDADFLALRGTLVFRPSDATTITAQVNQARDRGDNSQSDVLGVSATGFREPDTDPHTYYGTFVPRIHSDQSGAQVRLDQALGGGLHLTAIGAHIDLDRRYTFDPGDPRRSFDLDYQDHIKQDTVEVRLRGDTGRRVDWTAGAFYFRDTVQLGSLLDASDLVRTVFQTDYRQTRESWSLFGEADWKLAPRLTLTTGLRYNDETANFRGATLDLNPYGASVAGFVFTGVPVRFDNDFADDNVSGRVVLSYRPDDGALLYGSFSRGFKSGGFDGSTIFSAPEALPFRSEQVNAYEVGAKMFGRGRPFTLTTAAFYYDFSDLQANSIRTIGPVTTAIRTNVAKATIKGAEIDLTVRPTADARVGFNAAYLDSQVDDFVSSSPAEVARRNGNALPDTPEMSFNIDAAYVFHLADGWDLEPQVNVNFMGKHFKEIDNFVPVASYTLVNLRLALTSPDRRWTLAAFGRNVTDETYFVGVIPAATSAGVVTGQQRIVGAPATYGLSLSLRY
ncbi:Pesticin receptor precursor [Brevundimonas sp. SH203]|uniref:TonB-dependent receptor n=1 Tax=Brevundimonas sp. SH203 TaxID=345167 RepID=UPI0009CF00CE|nr:TonB-dependent receptor [Brevundimonas sp. SH203]GAW40613.1 Pesticin receptor precursor [Brevundimonas sp. SH203]